VRYLIGVLCLFFFTPAYSADILVATEDARGWEEGDAINVFNSPSIHRVHAQHQVHPKFVIRAENGRINAGTLLETYLDKTMECKFERISSTEVRRTNRFENTIDTISATPNADGEYMHVQTYIDRRISLKPNKNKIFGSVGAEYWFGGKSSITVTTMDQVWDGIEAEISVVRIDTFPFTANEIRKYAVLRVNDLSPRQMREVLAASTTARGDFIKAREKKIDFTKTNLSASERIDLLNPLSTKDFRHRNHSNIDELYR